MAKKTTSSQVSKSAAQRVLYRKYRPTKLSDVVGQSAITGALQNAIDRGHPAHAYLFIGPRGTGKTSVARIFAHAVNDFEYRVEDSYLDIIEIDAASNTGVDNIRELREKAIIAPTKGRYKVYIIDEVHMLTKSASNALLKTLEEPPKHVIFIMATTDAYKVPITISSRTQVFTFQLADPDTMFDHLRKIAKQESIKIDDDALQLIVRRGGGSFRDSLSLLDQISNLMTGTITADTLSHALGLPQDQIITQLLQSYQNQDFNAIHSALQTLLNTGIKPEIIAEELIQTILRQPQPSLVPLLEKLPTVQPPFSEAKLLLALVAPSAQVVQIPPSPQNISTAQAPLATPNITQPASKPPTPKAPVASAEPPQDATPAPVANDPTINASSITTVNTANFSWEQFLEVVHQDNDAIYLQLQKVKPEFDGTTLHLYPERKFTKNILEKPNNQKILISHLDGIALIIHSPDDYHPPEDAALSQISAIMGKVQEVNDNPFA